MSKKQKEALVFVVNVGKTSKAKAENETESFLDKSKNVIKQVIERKIFMRPQDLIGVICFGSNESKNNQGMDYIQELKDDLLVPSWNLVEEVLALEGTDRTSNWVEGLHVALEFMKKQYENLQYIRKIMILNDFEEEEDIIEQFNVETIKSDVQETRSQLIFIGKNPMDEADGKELNSSERLAMKVCNKVNGVYEEINRYFWETRFYKNPPVKPTPWRCALRIADIQIPTSSYVKVTEPPPFPTWKITTRNNSAGFPPDGGDDVKKTRELVDRYKDVTDPDDAIKGFKYGGKFIPFSEEDTLATKFSGTEKSLIVRGFVKQEDISIEYWFGKGCHVVVPEGSDRQFYSLLTAMRDAGLVAIVRKVYCANSIPKMGVLFPRMQPGEPACFVHVSIPFAEERRILKSRPVKTLANNLTEEQKKDIADYIEAFTLPPNEDGEIELYNPGSFCDPCKQYKWDSLSHRALNRVPLPPMDKALLDLISTPESLIEKGKPVIERLKTWVEPPKVEKPKEEAKNGVDNEKIEKETQQTEEEMMRAAEEAENEMKTKEDLFNEISEATMAIDEDLMNEM